MGMGGFGGLVLGWAGLHVITLGRMRNAANATNASE